MAVSKNPQWKPYIKGDGTASDAMLLSEDEKYIGCAWCDHYTEYPMLEWGKKAVSAMNGHVNSHRRQEKANQEYAQQVAEKEAEEAARGVAEQAVANAWALENELRFFKDTMNELFITDELIETLGRDILEMRSELAKAEERAETLRLTLRQAIWDTPEKKGDNEK